MENNGQKEQQQQQGGEQAEMHSEFLSRLNTIPIICMTLGFARDLIKSATDKLPLLGKASHLLETGIEYARKLVSPVYEQFRPIAAAPLAKVDNLATKGLDTLERTVPAIKKQPQEIVSDTKEIISSKVTPAVERLNEVSENVLSSRPAQFTFDCYEKVLAGGSHVVNTVLSSGKEEANGFPHEKAPESAVAKPGWLIRESLYLMTNTVQRLFGVAQSRADSVVHSVRKTL